MSRLDKKARRHFLRFLRRMKLWSVLRSISREKYDEKISAAIVYGLLSSVAVNFFYEPGHVYSSGATGLAQLISAITERWFIVTIPVSYAFFAINLPLIFLAWRQIGHKFTIFTFITVACSSIFIRFMPETTLSTDPVINSMFGGAILGTGIGYALRSNISSGGTDIVSLTVRKRTGLNVGRISMIVNGFIMLAAGIMFGWQYALYSMISIFVSSRVTDAVFTKQKKMQVTIITGHPEQVIRMIQKRLQRGVTIVNEAEGGYYREQKKMLITIITRAEYNDFKKIMRRTDPHAFVSIAENVTVMGRFVED